MVDTLKEALCDAMERALATAVEEIIGSAVEDELSSRYDDAFFVAIERGILTAKCSQCRSILTPEEHNDQACPKCGPFLESGDPQAVYVSPQ